MGQIKLLFQLPKEIMTHSSSSGQLAYVEWFTPFQVRDKTVNMYTVSRSTRNRQWRASVIPITHIARTCHLIPVWGRSISRGMTGQSALDRCERFFVNPYVRHSDFVIFRLLVDRWLEEENSEARRTVQ